jgi:hypothetical protein
VLLFQPNANASTKPENVPVTEAELGCHVLQMCPIQWQDQYNMYKKGMTPMDMHLLLTSLEAIKRVYTHEKAKSESSKKASHKGKKGKKHPGTKSTARVPKKGCFEKHCDLCKSHGGAYTLHNTHDYRRFEKGGKEKSNFRVTKKGGKKANAKLGSHGRKDITKVMAITNRNGKGDHSNPVREIGYLDTCKYPAG